MQVVKRYNAITKRHFIIFSSTEARPGSSTRRVVPPRWIDLQAEWDEREAKLIVSDDDPPDPETLVCAAILERGEEMSPFMVRSYIQCADARVHAAGGLHAQQCARCAAQRAQANAQADARPAPMDIVASGGGGGSAGGVGGGGGGGGLIDTPFGMASVERRREDGIVEAALRGCGAMAYLSEGSFTAVVQPGDGTPAPAVKVEEGEMKEEGGGELRVNGGAFDSVGGDISGTAASTDGHSGGGTASRITGGTAGGSAVICCGNCEAALPELDASVAGAFPGNMDDEEEVDVAAGGGEKAGGRGASSAATSAGSSRAASPSPSALNDGSGAPPSQAKSLFENALLKGFAWCQSCEKVFHGRCLDPPQSERSPIFQSGKWCCQDCVTCAGCGERDGLTEADLASSSRKRDSKKKPSSKGSCPPLCENDSRSGLVCRNVPRWLLLV